MGGEKMKGFFNSLTPKQQEAALGYDGPENFGFPMTSENAAPADMPGVEEIARAIYEQRNGYGAFAWSRRDAAHKQPYLMDARAVLALFAPKAEKPPTREDDAASSEIAVQSQPRIGAKRAAPILPPATELGQWKARALAAEAAVLAVAPHVDSIVCYASTIDEHDGNRIAKLVNEAAAAIRAEE